MVKIEQILKKNLCKYLFMIEKKHNKPKILIDILVVLFSVKYVLSTLVKNEKKKMN